jgi:hypothetical protein
MSKSHDPGKAFGEILRHKAVQRAAQVIRGSKQPTLIEMLELGRSLAEAVGDGDRETQLRAELVGYEAAGLEIPSERRVVGFASAFPVRAIGLLDPEEIFLANREKFSQVTLTIGQAVSELEQALEQIQQGGVLALKVAASEVTGEAALTDADTEVFIYILPREIERVVASARKKALDALAIRIVEASGVDAPAKDEHTEEGELGKRNGSAEADEITHGRGVELPRPGRDPSVD